MDNCCRNTAGLLWAFWGVLIKQLLQMERLTLSGKMRLVPPRGIVRDLLVSDGDLVSKGDVLMVVESEGTKARLQSTQKQLAMFRYENQLFNLLLDQSGRYGNECSARASFIDPIRRSYSLSSVDGAKNIGTFGALEDV